MNIPGAIELNRYFREDRPVLNEANSNIDFLISLLLQETIELQQEPTDGMSREQYLIQEAADIALFSLTLLDILTGDADMAIKEKIARNMVKYPAHLFQGQNTYKEAVDKSKQQWTTQDNTDFYSS